MGRRYDDRRWIQNPDGSFSRRTDVVVKKTAAEDLPVVAVPEPIIISDLEVNATKAAITLAQDLAIDLSTVTGTGKNGKITKTDVQAAA